MWRTEPGGTAAGEPGASTGQQAAVEKADLLNPIIICPLQVEDNRVPLQLVSLGPLIRVKQPGPDDEIFSLFNEQSVRFCRLLTSPSCCSIVKLSPNPVAADPREAAGERRRDLLPL